MAKAGFSNSGLGFGVIFSLKDNFSKVSDKITKKMGGLDRTTTKTATNVNTSLNRIKSGFKMFAAGGAILAPMAMFIGKSAELSDALADVQKTTGLTNAELAKFRDTVEGFDTRTSLTDLLDIGKIGGKLGVPKQELIDFTRQIDKAVVALGDDFTGGAEQVATVLGKIKTIFADTKNQKFGVALNSIGSALNELGNSGANSAENVAKFTQRMGQLGVLAPKLSETLGLGATLEEIGIGADIASGGLTNVLSMAGKFQTEFAQFLGITDKQFKSMLDTSPNEVITTLAKSMQGLSSSDALVAMEGLHIGTQESMKVILGLSSNMDLLTKRQKLASKALKEGTSLTAEFNIKNNTLQASIDKAKKSLVILATRIGDTLLPVANILITAFNYIISILGVIASHPITKFLLRLAGIIAIVSIGLGVLRIAIGLGTLAMQRFKMAALGVQGALLWVVAPIILIVHFIQKAQKAFSNFNGEVATGFTGFLQKVGGVIAGVKEIWSSWDNLTQTFTLSKGLAQSLKQLGILDFVVSLGTWLVRIKEFLGGIWDGMKMVFKGIASLGKAFLKLFSPVLKIFDKIGISIKKNTTAVDKWRMAGKVAGIVIGAALAAIALGFVAMGISALISMAPIILIVGLIGVAVFALIKIIGWVVDGFKWLFSWVGKMVDVGKNIVYNLWEGMKSVWGSFTGWLLDQLEKVPLLGLAVSFMRKDGGVAGIAEAALAEAKANNPSQNNPSQTTANNPLQAAITDQNSRKTLIEKAQRYADLPADQKPTIIQLLLDGDVLTEKVVDKNNINESRE